MKRIFLLILFFCFALSQTNTAQTVSGKIIDSFNPSTVRNVYEIIRHLPLDESKQLSLAKLIEEEDAFFVKKLKEEVVISVPTAQVLKKLKDDNLKKVLNEQELDQYYRGISDAEAEAMAVEVREKTKAQLGTSYEEGKYIFASFYKIFLESKVAQIKYADKPKILENKLKQIKEDELKVLLEKCGISVDDNYVAKRVWKFKQNTPYRDIK
jgi:ribosomal protein L12E/L44/L45/RPP1/RPP2